jgi:hypothetical protein
MKQLICTNERCKKLFTKMRNTHYDPKFCNRKCYMAMMKAQREYVPENFVDDKRALRYISILFSIIVAVSIIVCILCYR